VIGTGTRDGLDAAHAVLRDCGGTIAENKAGGSRGEFGETSDRKVLVVESGIVQQNLSGLVIKYWIGANNGTGLEASDSCAYLPDDGQNPRFGIIIPVSTNSQVDFLREGIDFERGSELENAVWGSERDLFPCF
jgi:hypothetical protein